MIDPLLVYRVDRGHPRGHDGGSGRGDTPGSDVELAKQRMADFKRRMNAQRRTPPRTAGKDAPPRSAYLSRWIN